MTPSRGPQTKVFCDIMESFVAKQRCDKYFLVATSEHRKSRQIKRSAAPGAMGPPLITGNLSTQDIHDSTEMRPSRKNLCVSTNNSDFFRNRR